MSSFGERLKRLRRENNVTQGELANFIGVVASAVGKYERLPQSYPSVEALIKISDYFKVSIDYLLKGDNSSSGVANNIRGHVSNSPFIQGNHGEVVINNEPALSPESEELLHIYKTLGGRERLELLNHAIELERGIK